MVEMIRQRMSCAAAVALFCIAGAPADTQPGASQSPAPEAPTTPAPETPAAPVAPKTSSCLPTGDGYLRADLKGAIEARLDWPNSGTHCDGEPKSKPAGVRLSFQRVPGGTLDLLFVFGLTGVREGRPAREVGANLTLIVQGTDRIFGTLGDSRCTVDSLKQRRLPQARSFRVEARGFCTQPAHAVRGDGAVLVSTFEFAGLVRYDSDTDVAKPARAIAPDTPVESP